jgi:hypothetical protein
MCGPMKAFLSSWVDQGKFSCLYGWTYESFPVFIGGPAEAFLSFWVDLRKLSCLQGWTVYSMSLHVYGRPRDIYLPPLLTCGAYFFLCLTNRYYLPSLLTYGAYFLLCLTNRYNLPSLLTYGAYFFLCLTNRILPAFLVDMWSLPASTVEMHWR